MKTKIVLSIIIAMLSVSTINTYAQTSKSDKKILIAYFSWSSSGNTRNMAEQIKAATGADIFEIVPVKAYPREYQACVDQAKEEINANFKPEIKGKVENIDSYDIIIVGSPNWWSTVAPPVATFLSNYNFSGKTILPFMTHEGTRLGHSVKDIKELCPTASVLSGLAIRGGSVKNASTANDIQKWLKDNGIIK
jgi:flavodoxin